MGIDNFKRSLTISNSPIEFALIGPKGKRNGVLVRSKNLQIDLIGFAITGEEKRRSVSTRLSRGVLLSSFFPLREMNCIESQAHDIGSDWDKRESEYRLCWVGACSSLSRREIRATFNRYMTDLLSGIEQEDLEKVEWSLAPTILGCSDAHMVIKRRRQSYLLIVAMYTLISVITASIYWFRMYLR
jgi:hypothetical protein